jgi:L-Ala-D/L-Glu epimerase
VKIRYDKIDLKLRHTFTIARGSRDHVTVVIVELEQDGITGYGEASPILRYNETPDTVIAFLKKLDILKFKNPFALENHYGYMHSLSEKDKAARAAVDIALHDWMGKALGQPLHKIWGLDPADSPQSSFTIGIDTPDVIAQKVKEAEAYPILKVKLGGDNDREIMETIRSITDKPIRVDANEGWKTREEALGKIEWLSGLNVEFVEQPMPADRLLDTAWIRERVSMPLIADENVLSLYDVPRLPAAFDGINIKLMKCGGLTAARKMIYTAQALKMKVMLGCMIESSVAISAAAQLSPLLDYADLDGNLLISNDPFDGVYAENGTIVLSDSPGTGVRKRGGG